MTPKRWLILLEKRGKIRLVEQMKLTDKRKTTKRLHRPEIPDFMVILNNSKTLWIYFQKRKLSIRQKRFRDMVHETRNHLIVHIKDFERMKLCFEQMCGSC